MARIRTLKPEILEDEKTAGLTDSTFRLFTSMIILADDHGNVRADVRWLQGQIWWRHNAPPNVLSSLIELVKAPLIMVYGVRGGTYAHLLGWEKHQRIDNAGKNRVPLPNDADAHHISLDEMGAREDSPRFAAKFGEIPLDPDHDQDPDKDVPPPRDPADQIPDEAWRAADLLRSLLLGQQPKNRIAKAKWGADVRTGTRMDWADTVRLIATADGRSYAEIETTIRWLFGEQRKSQYAFVVQSPGSLRDKWDRIAEVMRRGGQQQPIAYKQPANTEDKAPIASWMFDDAEAK